VTDVGRMAECVSERLSDTSAMSINILIAYTQYKNLCKMRCIVQSLASTQRGPLLFRDFASGSVAYMFIFLSQQEYLSLSEEDGFIQPFLGLLYAVSLLSTKPQSEWVCTHVTHSRISCYSCCVLLFF